MTVSDDADHEPKTVNLAQPWTRAYWARRFEVTIEQVQAAVDAVGSDPERVAVQLGRPWPFEGSGIV